MDYSDYILVGFGDCQTYGQFANDITFLEHKRRNNTEGHYNYSVDCHNNSYIKLLEKKLGFKDSINFSSPALCNDRTSWYIDMFLNNIKHEKYLVLVGLSYMERKTLFVENNDGSNYPLGIWEGHAEQDIKNKKQASGGKFNPSISELKNTFWDQYFRYMRNDLNIITDHMQTFDYIYYMLSDSNIKFIMFDMLSTLDFDIFNDKCNFNISQTNHEKNISRNTELFTSLNNRINYFFEKNKKRKYYVNFTEYDQYPNLTEYLNKDGKLLQKELCNFLSEKIDELF